MDTILHSIELALNTILNIGKQIATLDIPIVELKGYIVIASAIALRFLPALLRYRKR